MVSKSLGARVENKQSTKYGFELKIIIGRKSFDGNPSSGMQIEPIPWGESAL